MIQGSNCRVLGTSQLCQVPVAWDFGFQHKDILSWEGLGALGECVDPQLRELQNFILTFEPYGAPMDIYLKFAHPSHSNEFQTDQHSQVCPKGCCNRRLTPTKEQEQDIPVSMVQFLPK